MRRLLHTAIAVLMMAAMTVAAAPAAMADEAGDLVETFGDGGVADIGNGNVYPNLASAAHPDGVVVGSGDLVGLIDADTGAFTQWAAPADMDVIDLAVGSDGKTWVIGQDGTDHYVGRYNQDGSFDAEFGNDYGPGWQLRVSSTDSANVIALQDFALGAIVGTQVVNATDQTVWVDFAAEFAMERIAAEPWSDADPVPLPIWANWNGGDLVGAAYIDGRIEATTTLVSARPEEANVIIDLDTAPNDWAIADDLDGGAIAALQTSSADGPQVVLAGIAPDGTKSTAFDQITLTYSEDSIVGLAVVALRTGDIGVAVSTENGSVHWVVMTREAEVVVDRLIPIPDGFTPREAIAHDDGRITLVGFGPDSDAETRAIQIYGDVSGRFFDDNDSVHEADIESLAALGVTLGCNPPLNNQYCPTSTVTREQMASFFTRALGLSDPDPDGSPFTDTDGSVHATDIDAIAAVGVTLGCNPPTNDNYCPSAPVTRAQMASFITRAFVLAPVAAGSSGFTDIDPSVHASDIEAIAAVGITLGCNPPTNDNYCPDAPVTREQMATFLIRALALP